MKKSAKKATDYGTKGSSKPKGFGQVTMVKSNSQCKKAGTVDARSTQHK